MWRRVVCYKVPPNSGLNIMFSAEKKETARCTRSSVNIPKKHGAMFEGLGREISYLLLISYVSVFCRLEFWSELFSVFAGWGNTWRKTRKATLWYTRQIRRTILGLRKGSASSCNHHSSPPCCFRRIATQLPPWHQLPSQIKVSSD